MEQLDPAEKKALSEIPENELEVIAPGPVVDEPQRFSQVETNSASPAINDDTNGAGSSSGGQKTSGDGSQ